jgi:uncharacterized Rossmann fold enzyme
MPAQIQSIEEALAIGNAPAPTDRQGIFRHSDCPFLFGDDVIDGTQGVFNIASNASVILRAPAPLRCDSAPAIAVGGGPSVAHHLPLLRELQHKCLIVASQTSAQGLMDAGITPHLITPMERNGVMRKYTPKDAGKIVFAGAPLVHNDVMKQFKKHIYLSSADGLYNWCNSSVDRPIFFGSSTGTTAVNVAASMTSQKIYLVGHDLSYDNQSSHWAGSQAPRMDSYKQGHLIEGNNGELLPTDFLWLRLRDQISDTCLLHPGIVNVNAFHGVGAQIPGTLSESLPNPSGLPDFTFKLGEPNEQRIKDWRRHARLMPYHARKLRDFFDYAQDVTPKSTDIMLAGIGPNAHAFAYMMVSILTQLSYECRLGEINETQCLAWLKKSTHNFLTEYKEIFEQIAEFANASRD